MSKKIRKYAKEELDSGSSPEEVKTTLIAAGWEEEEVEKSLKQVLNGVSEEEIKVEEEELTDSTRSHKEKVRLFLFVLVIVLMVLLFLGVFLAFTSLDPQVIFG